MPKDLLGTVTGNARKMSDNLGDLGKGFGKQAGDLADDLGVGSMLQTGSKAATGMLGMVGISNPRATATGMLGMVGISSPSATIRPMPKDEGQVTCGTLQQRCGTLLRELRGEG